MNIEIIALIITTLNFIAIGVFTFWQSRTAENQRKQDLFDKRFEVYENLIYISRKIYLERGYKDNFLISLNEKCFSKKFLFGKEIESFFCDIEHNLRSIGSFKSDGEIFDHEKTLNELPEYKILIEYFEKLPLISGEKLEKYLRIK